MGSRFIDLTNQRFERLVVLERAEKGKHGVARWMVRCDCGTTKIVLARNLRTGDSKSCGCFQKEMVADRFRNNNPALKHGHARGRARLGHASPLYDAWQSMKKRCANPNASNYPLYGGRGISVCRRWLGDDGFLNFIADMGRKPSPKHSIDRIDVNGNYEPNNTRWATAIEQANNRRPRGRKEKAVERTAEQIAA